MNAFRKKEIEEARHAIATMIQRTEEGKVKFAQGTSQHTLLENRLKALNIASFLLVKELKENDVLDSYTEENYKNAVAPIASLISKSEKAQTKLAHSTWQYRMLSNNLKALYITSPLLMKALSETNTVNKHNK